MVLDPGCNLTNSGPQFQKPSLIRGTLVGETSQRVSGAIVLMVRRMHGAPKGLMARFPKPRAFRGGGGGGGDVSVALVGVERGTPFSVDRRDPWLLPPLFLTSLPCTFCPVKPGRRSPARPGPLFECRCSYCFPLILDSPPSTEFDSPRPILGSCHSALGCHRGRAPVCLD